MKIALIAPSYIPSKRANTIQTMKMCQAFSQLGHQVLLLVPGKDPNLGWEEISQHYGISKKFDVEWIKASPRLRRYDFAFKAVRHTRQWKAELLLTRVPQSAALASFLGFPTVFEIHDFPRSWMGSRLLKVFVKGWGAKALLSITKALADDLSTAFNIPDQLIHIAADGVDLNRFENLPSPSQARKHLALQEGFTVGYTGHLYPGRGSNFILDIAKEIPEINFLLVGGEARDLKNVQANIEKNKLTNVKLTGFVSNAQLPLYQAASDILLMPYQKTVSASSGGDISRYLSPMKMFEYLASERPIISSDLEVLQEVLNNKNSVILPTEDPLLWVEEIRKMKEDSGMRESLSTNARQTAEKHSWQSRAKQILTSLK